MKVRIGSRGSPLALWQAEHVKSRLGALGHDVDIRVITTTGDRIQDRSLEIVGGKGAFLKEIEEALLAGDVDLAVHSLKDVPTQLPAGLTLRAFLERADPRDALVSASGRYLEALPPGARIGTTSLRRRTQIHIVRSDLIVEDLRGNVDTRLRRLREGRFDAIILAYAGLVRLGREGEVTEIIRPEAILPAPGQGAIALECREADRRLAEAVQPLHHPPTARAVTAERSFLAALGGGCNVPLAAYAQSDGPYLRLRGFVARQRGITFMRGEGRGHEPEALGRVVAEDMLARGAAVLLSS